MTQWHLCQWHHRPMAAAAMAVVVINCAAAVDVVALALMLPNFLTKIDLYTCH